MANSFSSLAICNALSNIILYTLLLLSVPLTIGPLRIVWPSMTAAVQARYNLLSSIITLVTSQGEFIMRQMSYSRMIINVV